MGTERTFAELWSKTFGANALDIRGHADTFFHSHGHDEISAETLPMKQGISLGARIGKGGFANVYSAHQHSMRREVAVKQIRDQSRGDYLRFFHHEVWLTAGLNHPNILPIHDLVRIDGRPSLVMKRVDGQAWSAALRAAHEQGHFVLHHEIQRLVDVCDAVAFAHSRGVLHLDLKPANVMCGAFGETLVMDWGCAALFDDRQWEKQPDLPRTKNITKPFGTPAFMAPELARGEGGELGPHTDIYLLGATLHLLLSGMKLRKGATVLTTIEMAAQGERRPLPETAPSQLADLCRHATASELTDRLCDLSVFRDTLQHWLDTRESQALTERALETLSEMEEAETLTAGQRQEGTQLLGVFEQAGRSGMNLPQAIDGEWRLRQRLADAALRIGEPGVARVLAVPMPQQPRENIQRQAQELQAQQAYLQVNSAWRQESVAQHGSQAIESKLLSIQNNQRRALGEEHPDTLSATEELASYYEHIANYPKAESLFQHALNVHAETFGKAHARTLKSMFHLGVLRRKQGLYRDAEDLFVAVHEMRVALLGEEHSDSISALNSIANVQVVQKRYAESTPLFERILSLQKRILGDEHPRTLRSMNNLAAVYKLQDRYDDAESMFVQVLKVRERCLGTQNASTQIAYSNLAILYMAQQRFSEAMTLQQNVLKSRTVMFGEDHPNTQKTMFHISLLHQKQGQYQQAETLLLGIADRLKSSLGTSHPETLRVMHQLGVLYEERQQYLEAEKYLSQVYLLRADVLGPRDGATLNTQLCLAEVRLCIDLSLPRDAFQSLLQIWVNPADWKHHRTRLGLALCTLKESNDDTEALSALADLTALLGEADERVCKARLRIKSMRRMHHASC